MRYCQKTTIEQCVDLFKQARTVAIFAHTRPDGDSVGACVALRLLLEKTGKTCHMFCDTALGETFSVQAALAAVLFVLAVILAVKGAKTIFGKKKAAAE